MNQNKICIVKDHQEYSVTDICTFEDCKFITRWCCCQCLKLGLHNHQQKDYKHIMNRKEIVREIKGRNEIFKHYYEQYLINQFNPLQKILQMCQMIEKSLNDFKLEFHEVQQEINIMNQTFQKCMSLLNDHKFEWLNDEILNKLFSHKQNQIRKKQLIQPLNNVQQQVSNLGYLISDYKDKKIKDFQAKHTGSLKEIVAVKNRKYITQVIDRGNNYYGSSISQNEQYMAYGGTEKLLKIYDIKLNMIIKQINMELNIFVCQFTLDSSILYIGLEKGYVCAFQVKNEFKEIFKQQIHTSYVQNIIIIQNEYIITSSYDKTIIKTDVRKKQQIFVLAGHTLQIPAIDYNYQDEIIVSGSDDKSIKLWNCKIQGIIINKVNAHRKGITQIQLINNNFNILSLDQNFKIYKWKIDLENKDLIKIQSFIDQNLIFNFYQVNQNSNLFSLKLQINASIQFFILHKSHNSDNIQLWIYIQLSDLKYYVLTIQYQDQMFQTHALEQMVQNQVIQVIQNFG